MISGRVTFICWSCASVGSMIASNERTMPDADRNLARGRELAAGGWAAGGTWAGGVAPAAGRAPGRRRGASAARGAARRSEDTMHRRAP